ncbi:MULTISPECIES: DUF397 domain-containing protein [Nocardiopsis]|uniref:DUF397 domain-containing protein n=1 Tax=Nocardiopsis TaxID=2013 RepID=UPI0003A4B8FC|nr:MULTISPECIES: DUF397 domain-containing protein [Nocardiopsis]ASU60303.1 DUF397 domain-containing protein [Nocardiopsis dassonvillei]
MNDWHKSTYSSTGSNCVEAREHAGGVDVRDTQNRELGQLEFTASEWTALVDSLKHHG